MQVKTIEKDGYQAVQLGFGVKKAASRRGKKDKAAPPRYRREFAVEAGDAMEPGQKIDVSLFKAGDAVDVTGISKARALPAASRDIISTAVPRPTASQTVSGLPAPSGPVQHPARSSRACAWPGIWALTA
jgi:large subunit ribosomal protein L3